MYRFSDVVQEVAKNGAMGVPAMRRLRARRGRTMAADARDQARHLRAQFAFFMGTLRSVQGKSIVEIGPGDTAALGALFLQAGAISYTAYDRFEGEVAESYARSIYRELGCQIPDLEQRSVIRRIPIEDVDPSREQQADIIISFNTIEHLIDPHVALGKMAGILKPDGVMVHRVDYGPHDLWVSSPNPMTFLAVTEWLWALMGSNRGYPNRVRHAELMRTASDLGLNVVGRVTRQFKTKELAELRASPLHRFRSFSDQDMLVWLAEFTCARGSSLPLGPAFPY
jgi:SAM-dependent methyltransferase